MCSLHFSLDYEYYEYDFASCMTIGGPQPNKPCVFPFNFNGRIVNSCIIGKRPNSWCSIKKNYERGEWGFCNLDCLKLGLEPGTYVK